MYTWVQWRAIVIALSLYHGGLIGATPIKERLQSYDYIIVGGGSAGGVLAARLSEDDNTTVALLETGPDNVHFPSTVVPVLAATLPTTRVDWQYMTVEQHHACGALVGKKSLWSRGRALGGSSLINGMMVQRGNPHDYDTWAQMGNEGWAYQDVLPYFKKLEAVSTDHLKESESRGCEGPVRVEEPNPYPNITSAILNAAREAGFDIVDTNDGDKIGWMLTQTNTNRGRRASTAQAYIKPVMHRPNLHIFTLAHVTRVILEDKKAVGVRFVQNAIIRNMKADKEVILSAGAIGSPQLLMLSGIGPKHHLDSLEVRPLSWAGLAISGFSKSKHQPEADKNPHLQFVVTPGLYGQNEIIRRLAQRMYNVDPEVHKALHGNPPVKDGLTVYSALLHPQSTGELRLRSTNPYDYPIIDPNYLSEEIDVQKLVEGIRIAQTVLEQPSLQVLGARSMGRVHPHCANYTYDTDAYWECYVRSNTLTEFHGIGTCKMGPVNDSTAVVDSHLRVHGVSGLRVVDASIMPALPSGNTNFPVMMVAEKAAVDVLSSKRNIKPQI